MAVQWRPVSEEEARQRSWYGFGGWMYVLYALLIYLVWIRLSTVFRVPQRDLEVVFETARQASVMEYFALVEILLWLPFLVLAPIGHRLMPVLATWGFCAWWVLQAIMTMAVINIAIEKVAFANAITTLVAAVYVSYLGRSKRVNLTYRLRERIS